MEFSIPGRRLPWVSMMTLNIRITDPHQASLDKLCQSLRQLARGLAEPHAWPGEQLQICAEAGVYEWFIPEQLGGQGWDDADIVRGYLKLSAACLTTTLVITQFTGACRRLAATSNQSLQQQVLPELISGRQFATLGISHLTTSRRYLSQPVLQAERSSDGFRLQGFSPWVTGGRQADFVLTGATMNDGQQLLVLLPMDSPGVSVPEPAELVGLTASQTGPVHLEDVEVAKKFVLAGPAENIMSAGTGAKTGGLQTSTLAIGLASSAIEFIESEADKRGELGEIGAHLRNEWTALHDDLLSSAVGNDSCTPDDLRQRSNSLVLRSTQAALAAAKGSGYVVGHPVGRWCQESLFFLVWSCPQPVMMANLCEFAGMR